MLFSVKKSVGEGVGVPRGFSTLPKSVASRISILWESAIAPKFIFIGEEDPRSQIPSTRQSSPRALVLPLRRGAVIFHQEAMLGRYGPQSSSAPLLQSLSSVEPERQRFEDCALLS